MTIGHYDIGFTDNTKYIYKFIQTWCWYNADE